MPRASDALVVLRAAVGLVDCALCVCDVNDSGSITSTDALLDLRLVVGQDVTLSCPDCASGNCPAIVEWTTHSGFGPACSENADCAAGNCESGVCRTATTFDAGWTGAGHEGDLADGSALRVEVDCEGTGGDCGACTLSALDTTSGSCRCENDPRRTCDDAFAQDFDDCPACLAGAYVGLRCASNVDCDAGTCSRRCDNDLSVVCSNNGGCNGGNCVATKRCSNGLACNVDSQCTGTCTSGSACQCFDGPPLPVSVGGTPFCLMSQLTQPLTGTVDVDTGDSRLVKTLRLLDYPGSAAFPCPVCGGRCSNNPQQLCNFDAECGSGNSCTLDAVAGDGVQGGKCIGGGSNGEPCDIDARSASLPAASGSAGGGGYSLDCSPAKGPNATGPGAVVTFVESTADSQMPATLPCGDGLECPCLVCSTDPKVACHSDADCTAVGGLCNSVGTGTAPEPNQCEGYSCSSIGDGKGQCTTGPDDKFCDHLVEASGRGIVRCDDHSDCAGGSCSLVQRRSCFPGTVTAAGDAHPRRPITAATLCVPAVASPAKNTTIGFPGPVRIVRQSRLRSYCANDANQLYRPGEGGCPEF